MCWAEPGEDHEFIPMQIISCECESSGQADDRTVLSSTVGEVYSEQQHGSYINNPAKPSSGWLS